jgi:outer membrane protein TolC
LRVQSAEASVASAQAGHLPTLGLTANANVGPKYNTVNGATLAEIGTLGGTFTIPIFDAGVNANVAAAEAELLVAQATLRQQTVDIRGAAAQAAIAVRSTAASVAAAQELVAEADENFRQAQGRYELGAASVLEITQAEQQESQATLSLIQAKVQADAARLRLLVAIGTLRPSATKP